MQNNIFIFDDYLITNKKKFFYHHYLSKNYKNLRKKYLNIIERISENNNLKNNFKYKKLNLVDFFYTFEKNPYKNEFYLSLKLLTIIELFKRKKSKILINNILNERIKQSVNIFINKKNFINNISIFYKIGWLIKCIFFLLANLKLTTKKFATKKNIIFTYSKFSNDRIIPDHWADFDLLNENEKENITFFCFPTKTKFFYNKFNGNKKIFNINSIISNYTLIKSFIEYFNFYRNNFFCNHSNFFHNKIDRAFINILFLELNKDALSIRLFLNLVYINFFENLKKHLNKNSRIFYIYENFAWQRILGKCQLNSVNKCYAFQHSSVRFWDTRYFSNKSKYYPKNYLISNKPYFTYLKNNFSLKTFKVENLRFNKKDKKSYIDIIPQNRILIFLDHIYEDNLQLIKILEKSMYVQKKYKFTIQSMHLNNFLNKRSINIDYSITNNITPNHLSLYKYHISVGASGSVEDILQINKVPIIFRPNKIICLSPIEYTDKFISFS